jgi:antitoxin HicB
MEKGFVNLTELMTKRWDIAYPCFIERDPETDTYGGFCVDVPVFVAGKASPEEAQRALEEGVAFYLAHLEVEGRAFPEPGSTPPPELDEEVKAYLTPVTIRPSPVNEVSLEIEKALRRKGLKRKDLAQRMGVPASVVSRILDPLYFGHTLSTLRKVAQALESGLEVRLTERPQEGEIRVGA